MFQTYEEEFGDNFGNRAKALTKKSEFNVKYKIILLAFNLLLTLRKTNLIVYYYLYYLVPTLIQRYVINIP